MAAVFARDWGIPVPARIKLIEDKTLPTYEFKFVGMSSDHNPNRTPPSARFSVRSEPDQVVVQDPGTAPEKQRLKQFLASYGLGKVQLSSKKLQKDYYLVPKWTQPVWKLAGHSSVSREGLIALSAASAMLENPELLLTTESVVPILKRIAERRPHSVEQALAARGGLAGLTDDLREIVRLGIGLVHIEYLLDFLAAYSGLPSAEAVSLALDAHDGIPEGFPAKLSGTGGSTVPELSVALNSKAPFQYAYDEVSVWLPLLEQPIRVMVGRNIEKRFFDGNELAADLQQSLIELRRRFYGQFGFIPPAVRFKLDETIRDDEFRIEILNQTKRHPDAQPITPERDQALATLIDELQRRYITARHRWLHTDEVSQWLAGLSKGLRLWLLNYYTLTDLKLLLQAQIAPIDREVDAYESGHYEDGYRMIHDEATIEDLSWLLGSLTFFASTGADMTNIPATIRWLRDIQRARTAAAVKPAAQQHVMKLVQNGIDRLASGDMNEATATFRTAVTADRRQAGQAFVALYPAKVSPEERIVLLEKECRLPAVGGVITAGPPSMSTRYLLEELLAPAANVVSTDRRRPLELCLLWIYAGNKHTGPAQRVIASLLSQDVRGWRAEDKYLLAGFMLRLHGQSMAEPANMPHIHRLLSEAIRSLPLQAAEAVFQELLGSNDRQLSLWRTKLLFSLTQLQPQSFHIPFEFGMRLASGRNVEEAGAALKLLEKAKDRIDSQEPDERDRLNAWISYFSGVAWLTYMEFGDRSAYGAIQKLAPTINTREEQGWPSPDDVTTLHINAHILADELSEATAASEDWLRRSSASHSARENAMFVRLANLDVIGALKLARNANREWEERDEQIAYKIALLELLSGSGDFEGSAKHFLEKTKHQYRDYIRLMLFWRLKLQGRTEEAGKLLHQRWMQIDSGSWKERLVEGDTEVWREMVIGYFIGEVSRQQLFGSVADPGAFAASPLSLLGMSYTELRGEAYFYDALLQDVSGEPATRRDRSRRCLEEVLKLRGAAVYEYHLARYLLSDKGTVSIRP
jgi:hypothetical protein